MTDGYMPNENIKKVVIIGRANVGKSTLFNRLTESGKAIVSPIPGTTRDRNYGECSWRGKKFTLVDTGGLEKLPTSDILHLTSNTIENKIATQTLTEIETADLVLLLLDANDGVLPQEEEFAKLLRKENKRYLTVVNKVDNQRIRNNLDPDIYKLSQDEPQLVSAINGTGTGDLLDEIINKLPKQKEKKLSTINNLSRAGSRDKQLAISIIGRPNVGKSSLLNALLGEERVIVDEKPHTTRETQEFTIKYKKHPKKFAYSGNLHSFADPFEIKLIDTAGIRRKSKINNALEKQGVRQGLGTLKRADFILFVIEANSPISRQDKNLARLIVESRKPVLVVANKWDLTRGQETSEYEKFFKAEFPHLSFAPVIFISAKTGRRVDKILDQVLETKKESEKQITANALSKFLKKIIADLKKYQGRQRRMPRLLDLKQTSANPPTFEIVYSATKNQKLASSVIKYIENRLREKFGFIGTPIVVESRAIELK